MKASQLQRPEGLRDKHQDVYCNSAPPHVRFNMPPSDHRSKGVTQGSAGQWEAAENAGMEEQNVLSPSASGLSPHSLLRPVATMTEGPTTWAISSTAVGTALKSGACPHPMPGGRGRKAFSTRKDGSGFLAEQIPNQF